MNKIRSEYKDTFIHYCIYDNLKIKN